LQAADKKKSNKKNVSNFAQRPLEKEQHFMSMNRKN